MIDFHAPVEHRLYSRALDIFGAMCRDAPDGMALVMVGPTQAGKSYALRQIYDLMQMDRLNATPGSIPLVQVRIEAVREGRVKPKWLSLQLLKAVKHPVYMHIGELDEMDHYIPSRGRDEESLRVALTSAMASRKTNRVVLDEVHLLTRTANYDLRGSLLEAIKSIAAVERTLIACGGYELVCKGIFDSAHFAGRTVIFDFGNYTSNKADLDEWERILGCYSNRLHLSDNSLLIDRCEALLIAANGSIGLLSKWLWSCKVIAMSRSECVNLQILKERAPTIKEQAAIAKDIFAGRHALALHGVYAGEKEAEKPRTEIIDDNPSVVTKGGSETKRKRRPFEAKPKRAVIGGIEVWTS